MLKLNKYAPNMNPLPGEIWKSTKQCPHATIALQTAPPFQIQTILFQYPAFNQFPNNNDQNTSDIQYLGMSEKKRYPMPSAG